METTNNNQPKHTHGEWEVNYGNKNQNRFIENFSSYEHAHSIHSGLKTGEKTVGFAVGRTEEEAEANAKLIASAPVLLEALKECRKEFSRLHKEMSKPANERDSFWIEAFFKAPMCGQDLLSLADKLIKKATE